MRSISFSLLLLIMVLVFLFGCNSRPVKLVPLSPFEDTGSKSGSLTEKFKIRYYYVENFKDNKRKELVNLVLLNLEKNFAQYESYDIYIYRKTETLNESFISSSDKNDIGNHMNDIIFICQWSKGEFFSCIEFDDGNVVRSGPKLIEK